jgi:hypothetical protein
VRYTSVGKRDSSAAPPSNDAVLAALGARQHGVARTTDLLDARLSPSAISRRVARGNLHRVYPGVYAIGHRALSPDGELLAGVFAGGDGAALGRLSAARLWEAWKYKGDRIDVIVRRRQRARASVRFHVARNLHPRDVTEHRGIPVTTMARTLVDLTDCLTKWELASVIHEAAYRGRYVPLATQDAIARANGRRNLKALQQAITLHESGSAGVRSRDELRFLIASERAGNPEPLVNTALNGIEVDFHWPALQLAIELDGPGHERPRTREEDAYKTRAWREAGYEVLRFSDPWAATESVACRSPSRGRRGRARARAASRTRH